MNQDSNKIYKAYDNTVKPQRLSAHYQATDGYTEQKTFSGPDAEEQLKQYIDERVGLDGEISRAYNYIVSTDGVGRVAVKGIQITDLLGYKKLLGPVYVRNLAVAAMRLNAPVIEKCPLTKKEDESRYGGGFQFNLTWKEPARRREKGHIWDPVERKYNLVDMTEDTGHFIFSVEELEKVGTIYAWLCIFYMSEDMRHRYGEVDNNVVKFMPTGKNEEDILQLDPLFKRAGGWIDHITPFITKQLPA